jgi:hypothetical protein
MKLTGKKSRKLCKKRDKIIQVIEGSRGNFAEGKFAKLELHWDNRTTSHVTSPCQRNIAIGNNITVRLTLQMGRKEFMVCH